MDWNGVPTWNPETDTFHYLRKRDTGEIIHAKFHSSEHYETGSNKETIVVKNQSWIFFHFCNGVAYLPRNDYDATIIAKNFEYLGPVPPPPVNAHQALQMMEWMSKNKHHQIKENH